VGTVAPKGRNITGDVMGGVCDRHGREVHTGSWSENFKEGDRLEHLDLSVTVIQK
jgi:hypothetical protein